MLSFLRRGNSPDSIVLVVCNFTPVPRPAHRVGVPNAGVWHERLNTDSTHYGGSNVGSEFGEVTADAHPWQGRAQSIAINLPPLATVFYEWTA